MDLGSVNSSVKELSALGLVTIVERAPFLVNRNEYILFRITDQGVSALREMKPAQEPPSASQLSPGNLVSVTPLARGGDDLPWTRVRGSIDARGDISEYERDDLRRKLEDLVAARSSGDAAKAGQIEDWLSKHAPWLASELPRSG